MANLDFGDEVDLVDNVIDESIENDSIDLGQNENDILGLTQEEIADPNSIDVSLADKNTPIVVLFGPTTSGKTMLLRRITRYLSGKGYSVSPVRTFRPSEDTHYEKMCNNFNNDINSNNSAAGTNLISFMLVNIARKKGAQLCQILEAPGEHYYSPGVSNLNGNDFPPYVNKIIESNNRKIWVILLEPNWKNDSDRRGYADRIKLLKKQIAITDKVIFLFNKVDVSEFVLSKGVVNIKGIKEYIENHYNNIFVPFQNDIPILKWFKEYNCYLLPFSNGTFSSANLFTEGADAYPEKLWQRILKIIKG